MFKKLIKYIVKYCKIVITAIKKCCTTIVLKISNTYRKFREKIFHKYEKFKISQGPQLHNLHIRVKLLQRISTKKFNHITNKETFDAMQISKVPEVQDYLVKKLSFSVNIVYRYIAITFLAMFLWSIFAKLDSSVYANGIFAPTTRKKIIQHFEGGIIDEILVKEGDMVKKGQTLVILNDVAAKANLNTNKNDLAQFLIREQRLFAELGLKDEFNLPSFDEIGVLNKISLKRMENYEINILLSNLKIHRDKLASLIEKQNSNLTEINKNKQKLVLYTDQMKIVQKDIKVEKILIKKHMSDYEKFRRLQTELVSVENEVQSTAKTLDQLSNTDKSIQNEIQLLVNEHKHRVNEDLSNVEQKINELKERINISEDIKARTHIWSPVDGVVTTLNVNGAGQTVNGNTAIMEIVPLEDEVIIEAKVSPRDVSLIYPGLEAKLIPNLAENKLKQYFMGTVFFVSQDSQINPHDGSVYFLAKIKTKTTKFYNITLVPGMHVSVLINLGSKAPIVFLLEPFLNSIIFAFNEY